MRYSKIILFLLGFGLVLLTACSSDEEPAKSMDTIHKEEGVPVKVEVIKKTGFSDKFLYNAVLAGINETSKYAMIGERIEKIHANVGDYVKKDQLIISFPSDNPSAKYSQARAAYLNAKNVYERNQSLYDAGGISEQNLENIKTQYEVAEADYEAASQMIRVKSPIDGYITNIAVKETQNVEKDQLLFTVARTKTLKADINVGEFEIDRVETGQTAYADWRGTRIIGKVTRVAMSMNPSTKSFNTIVEFDNAGGKVKAGVTADIHIVQESGEKIMVERKNIITESNKHYVFVVKNDKAVRKEIKINQSNNVNVVVEEGLTVGDSLITQGQMLLSDGSKVRIIGGVQ